MSESEFKVISGDEFQDVYSAFVFIIKNNGDILVTQGFRDIHGISIDVRKSLATTEQELSTETLADTVIEYFTQLVQNGDPAAVNTVIQFAKPLLDDRVAEIAAESIFQGN